MPLLCWTDPEIFHNNYIFGIKYYQISVKIFMSSGLTFGYKIVCINFTLVLTLTVVYV